MTSPQGDPDQRPIPTPKKVFTVCEAKASEILRLVLRRKDKDDVTTSRPGSKADPNTVEGIHCLRNYLAHSRHLEIK